MIIKGMERGGRALFKSFLSAFVSKGHLGLPKETMKSVLCFPEYELKERECVDKLIAHKGLYTGRRK
jgi:hypothetical protein